MAHGVEVESGCGLSLNFEMVTVPKSDVIVCWMHNWPECPKRIEVIELKKGDQGDVGDVRSFWRSNPILRPARGPRSGA